MFESLMRGSTNFFRASRKVKIISILILCNLLYIQYVWNNFPYEAYSIPYSVKAFMEYGIWTECLGLISGIP
jgi:predicted ferric reductase